MTVALVFLAAFAAAWAHWSLIGWAVIAPWLSVYVAAFLAVLVTAAVVAIRSKRAGPIGAAVVLAGHFLAGHVLWTKGMGMEARALMHLGFAAVFLVVFRARAAGLIALAFVGMVAADVSAVMGWLTPPAARPRVFLSFSHPDVQALLGHGASIILGFWSGGDRLAEALDRPWWPAEARDRWASIGRVSSGRE